MKSPIHKSLPQSADNVFLALGQTLYICQLLEATMLEVIATANELLDGTGDGGEYHASIEMLSRRTLGQLLNSLRKKADIRADIDDLLNTGLEARNFVVHHFAQYIGDDLADESKAPTHQRTLYEKCALIMTANDLGIDLLRSLAQLNSEKCDKIATELEETAKNALREIVDQHSGWRH